MASSRSLQLVAWIYCPLSYPQGRDRQATSLVLFVMSVHPKLALAARDPVTTLRGPPRPSLSVDQGASRGRHCSHSGWAGGLKNLEGELDPNSTYERPQYTFLYLSSCTFVPSRLLINVLRIGPEPTRPFSMQRTLSAVTSARIEAPVLFLLFLQRTHGLHFIPLLPHAS